MTQVEFGPASRSSIIIASFWFILSIGVAFSAVMALFTDAPIISIPVFGAAYLIFLIGRQRIPKYQLDDKIFNQRLLWIGSGIAILAGVSVTYIAT